MKIIFLGAPGAGKGTQAELVSKKLGIPTVSTGQIIREALSSGSDMGLKAKKFIDEGKLVPDDVVIGIVKDRLQKSDCDKGYILDGFPRTVPQAEALDAMGITLDAVVSLEVSDETIIERMSGRRVCPKCSRTYHTSYKPSPRGDLCECGEALTVRSDDKPEVVAYRLETYHDQTEPLKEFYQKKGNLLTVEGAEEVEETTKRTFKVLGI